MFSVSIGHVSGDPIMGCIGRFRNHLLPKLEDDNFSNRKIPSVYFDVIEFHEIVHTFSIHIYRHLIIFASQGY